VALLYFTFGEVDLCHISLPSLPVSGSSPFRAAAVAAPFVERRGASFYYLACPPPHRVSVKICSQVDLCNPDQRWKGGAVSLHTRSTRTACTACSEQAWSSTSRCNECRQPPRQHHSHQATTATQRRYDANLPKDTSLAGVQISPRK